TEPFPTPIKITPSFPGWAIALCKRRQIAKQGKQRQNFVHVAERRRTRAIPRFYFSYSQILQQAYL
ncbi:hypothetical protein, partial [Ochrobactrum sp. C6C9]|uniref:hypothetical protein n=1 Tax=Ochrobactrum sp. C6C9 TaxID=2736662 RepID=UPI0035304699